MRKGAGIVLATSVSNVKGMPSTSIYAASKAALRSITRTFARELIGQGVRVNAVSPGPIDTGILDRSVPAGAAEALKARMIANNPMGRFGSPEEIARAVAFLAFDATFTTGAELAVDGGVSQLL
jgi:NAD(P)-dependent dehydrogenase (short-subunit alcohol dehydrogenase family)